jgi:hypothetical protein
MYRQLKGLVRVTATSALLAVVALGISPAAFGSYAGGPDRSEVAFARTPGSYAGGPDRSEAALARYGVDPAIRTPIGSPSPEVPIAVPATVVISAPEDGFAWRAAAFGLAVGVAGMLFLLGCVTLVRHDGRLRSI